MVGSSTPSTTWMTPLEAMPTSAALTLLEPLMVTVLPSLPSTEIFTPGISVSGVDFLPSTSAAFTEAASTWYFRMRPSSVL